jgi:LPXTG-motif cell wall-anchored protein
VTNRIPTRSYGFDLYVGTGRDIFGKPFSAEKIPNDYITKQGPVIERSFAIDENEETWVRADYEQLDIKGTIALKLKQAVMPAMTLAMLAAVDPTAPPAGPGAPSNPSDPASPITPGDPASPSNPGGASTNTSSRSALDQLAHTGAVVGLPVVAGALIALLFGLIIVIRRRRSPSRDE